MAEKVRDASSSYFGKAKTKADKPKKVLTKEDKRKAKNAGSSSTYKMTSDYATALKKPKVKKKVNMPSNKSTFKMGSNKVKGTSNVKTRFSDGRVVKGFTKGRLV